METMSVTSHKAILIKIGREVKLFFQFKQKKQQVIHIVPVDNLLLLKISNCHTVNEFRFSATRPDENYRSKALWLDWPPDHSGQY